MNILQKAAEILVECGYSAPYKDMSYTKNDGTKHINYQLYTPNKEFPDEIVMAETCEPFSDTLEGRRQLEVLFDYYVKGMVPIAHFDFNELVGIRLQMTQIVQGELQK